MFGAVFGHESQREICSVFTSGFVRALRRAHLTTCLILSAPKPNTDTFGVS